MKVTISPERFDIFLRFLEFLRRNRALDSFLMYTTFFGQGLRALFVAQNFNPRRLILRAFYWDYSDNVEFWSNLNEQWQEFWDKKLARQYNQK